MNGNVVVQDNPNYDGVLTSDPFFFEFGPETSGSLTGALATYQVSGLVGINDPLEQTGLLMVDSSDPSAVAELEVSFDVSDLDLFRNAATGDSFQVGASVFEWSDGKNFVQHGADLGNGQATVRVVEAIAPAVSPVPLPASLPLLGVGVLFGAVLGRRRKV